MIGIRREAFGPEEVAKAQDAIAAAAGVAMLEYRGHPQRDDEGSITGYDVLRRPGRVEQTIGQRVARLVELLGAETGDETPFSRFKGPKLDRLALAALHGTSDGTVPPLAERTQGRLRPVGSDGDTLNLRASIPPDRSSLEQLALGRGSSALDKLAITTQPLPALQSPDQLPESSAEIARRPDLSVESTDAFDRMLDHYADPDQDPDQPGGLEFMTQRLEDLEVPSHEEGLPRAIHLALRERLEDYLSRYPHEEARFKGGMVLEGRNLKELAGKTLDLLGDFATNDKKPPRNESGEVDADNLAWQARSEAVKAISRLTYGTSKRKQRNIVKDVLTQHKEHSLASQSGGEVALRPGARRLMRDRTYSLVFNPIRRISSNAHQSQESRAA